MDDATLSRIPGAGPGGPPAGQGRDLSGQVIGDYKLVRKIAEGGMGEVYEAIQIKLDRRVAFKVLNHALTSSPEFSQRFEREAKSAAAINHPNLVQVHDFGFAGGLLYLVMELVNGESLAERVEKKGKLTTDEALGFIEQAVEALKSALVQSIIHRDVKPSNLLLTTDGRLKVSDLGLAKKLDDVSDVTITGVGLGSPHFLAPEQAEDASNVDHRADIYALGITLLYLLTGRRPYENASAFSVVLAHAQKPLPSGLELGTELPVPVESLIRKMAAKKPKDRYQDYDSLLTDLGRVRNGMRPLVGGKMNPRTKLLLVTASVAVVVGAGWMFFSVGPKATSSEITAVTQTNPVQVANAKDRETERVNLELGDGMPLPDEPERRGPRREPPDRVQGPFPFPMGRLPPKERNMLPAGSVPEQMAFCRAYAATNGTEFLKILDRYRLLSIRAQGTEWEAKVSDEFEEIKHRHQEALHLAMEIYLEKTQKLVREENFQEAYEIWKDFPINLRTPHVDQEIMDELVKILPKDFKPR